MSDQPDPGQSSPTLIPPGYEPLCQDDLDFARDTLGPRATHDEVLHLAWDRHARGE